MDFGETLLAAQRNQHKKPSDNAYYRTKFEPPKKESKPASKLSANIQKFLAKKEEEERRKLEEARRKRDELLAMRDPKATKKIQKMLKVIKSANKSVLAEAVDTEHTAVTRTGCDQPDQDDYGYESQEAAALYRKMMDKYSKMPEEEKFPAARRVSKKDLDSTRERMRAALQREEEPQPRQRKSRTHNQPEKEDTPPPPPENKPDKPKIRRALPPPIDFNQLLKLAEQKKVEPIALSAAAVKKVAELEPERPMTKRQKREYEEEQARRAARQRRLAEAESKPSSGYSRQQSFKIEVEKKSDTFTRIPKIGDKNNTSKSIKLSSEPPRKPNSEDSRRFEQDRQSSSKSVRPDIQKREQNTKIGLKTQNTYRIDKEKSQSRDSVKTDRDIDRMNIKYDREKCNGHVDRDKQRESERIRIDRPEKCQTGHSVDRTKGNREPERRKTSSNKIEVSRSKIGISYDKPMAGVDNRHNGRSGCLPNKPVTKHDQFRKPEMKEKTSSLFETDKPPAKPNSGTSRHEPNAKSKETPKVNSVRRPEIKSNDLSREGPSKVSKAMPNDRRPLTNKDRRPVTNNDRRVPTNNDRRPPTNNYRRSPKNNDMRPPVNTDRRPATNSDRRPPTNNPQSMPPMRKMESKSFDFDKHVSSLKSPERGGPRGSGRQFPPGDVRRKFSSGDQRGGNPALKRRIMDSESEYDSEMDDFIDDGDEEVNYSAAIRDIFGYDKNKYRDMDDDDAAMESSFAQQMREEYISKKIGIMEDLEDMRMEAMEKKRAKKRRRISDEDD